MTMIDVRMGVMGYHSFNGLRRDVELLGFGVGCGVRCEGYCLML